MDERQIAAAVEAATTDEALELMLTEVISQVELEKYEKQYLKEIEQESLKHETHFSYAVCLIRSRFQTDIKRGVLLLEDLSLAHPAGNRDYLYYLAIGYARLKHYTVATKFLNVFLQAEPGNPQVIALRTYLKKKQGSEAKVGLFVATGSALVLGGLVGLGMVLTRR